MSPLTEYILERAQKAKNEGLTEEEFFDQWSVRVSAQTTARNELEGAAIAGLVAEGRWPWP